MKPIGMKTSVAVVIAVGLITLMLLGGCSQSSGKPTFLSFMGDSSESAQEMKPIVDNLKETYKDRVIFKDIDMDDPDSKGEIDEYKVSMNPTFIVLNVEGQVKQTFMGAAMEEMLVGAIESLLPSDQRTTTPTDTAPGTQTAPQPSTSPMPIPSPQPESAP